MKGFEERLERLEQLAEMIRDRKTALEKAMAFFEEGVALSNELESELKVFEQKVEKLTNEPPEDGSGEVELETF